MATKEYFKTIDWINKLEKKYGTEKLSDIPDEEFEYTRNLMGFNTIKKYGGPKIKYKLTFVDFTGKEIATDTNAFNLSKKVKDYFVERGVGGYGYSSLRKAVRYNNGKTELGTIIKTKIQEGENI